MLAVEKLAAGYGPAQVLFDVTFGVNAGEVVTLLGRNGMGKTTTIRTLMGLLPARGGNATFEGKKLISLPSYRIAQRGLGLVPEGRMIFPTLSVEENLVATAASRFGDAKWTLARVYEFFPRLGERRANMGNQLSGGEQQMLAIGRALMTNPKLLILDADPRRNLGVFVPPEERRTGNPAGRQASRRADQDRRPPCGDREGSRGVDGNVGAARGGCEREGEVSSSLTLSSPDRREATRPGDPSSLPKGWMRGSSPRMTKESYSAACFHTVAWPFGFALILSCVRSGRRDIAADSECPSRRTRPPPSW
jgi:ABC-type lipoprotein export system ATPase subunit